MTIGNERDKRFLANSIFPSFFYAALALVLGQVGAAQMHGSWSLRVFLGAPGLALSGLALFRARLHWPAANAVIRRLARAPWAGTSRRSRRVFRLAYWFPQAR
jgi:hypothetical protein